MKIWKNNRGFTIVELVIVIAVIAILAAVLIPTFSSVIGKANESSALQQAKASLDVLVLDLKGDLTVVDSGTAKEADYYFTITKGGKDYVFRYCPKGNENGNLTEVTGVALGSEFTISDAVKSDIGNNVKITRTICTH